MGYIPGLVLPILAAAAAVWVYSAIAWMFLPHHRKDFKQLPDEDALMDAIRSLNIPTGNYMFPSPGEKCAHNDPAYMEKWNAGPTGTLNVWPKVNMGRNMLLTFLVNLVVSGMIAYIGWAAVPAGASFGHVFQVLGAAGVVGYAFAFIPNGIWFHHGRSTVMCIIDGVISGLITGAVFAALWPAGA